MLNELVPVRPLSPPQEEPETLDVGGANPQRWVSPQR